MSKYYSEEIIKDVIRKIETEDMPIGLGINPRTWCVMLLEELPTIEVSEDAISREWLVDYFSKGAGLFADNTETIIHGIKSAPSVIPKPKEGEWQVDMLNYESICPVCGKDEAEYIYGTEMWYGLGKSRFCPNCGKKMKGAER